MTRAYSLHPIPQIDYSCFRSKGLHFTHLNIRSLLPKLSQLKLTIKDTNAAVLSFSETWLDDSISDNEVEIEGCNIVRLDRNREGGCVCVYMLGMILPSVCVMNLPLTNSKESGLIFFFPKPNQY